MAKLCKAIGDQAVSSGEEIGAKLRSFPSGKIGMDSVEKGRVLIKPTNYNNNNKEKTHKILIFSHLKSPKLPKL